MTKQITSRSTKTISTGKVSMNDLLKYGYQSVTFYSNNKTIEVEVCGFISANQYFFNPKNKKEESCNNYFIDKYILKCDNSNELIQFLGINNNQSN